MRRFPRGFISFLKKEVVYFWNFFYFFTRKKILNLSRAFEQAKNSLVKVFMMKRGRYSRPFLHLTTMSVLGLAIIIAPYITDTYPIFASGKTNVLSINTSPVKQSIDVSDNIFQTDKSVNLRSSVVSYTAEKGDTLASIAQKFSSPNNVISAETIKWANNMTGDAVAIGDVLQIPPVNGIVHKVQKGDTVYTIAQKYGTDAQKIVDFPFNDFANPEIFSLVEGQILIVPDGVKPTDKPVVRPQGKSYVASAPVSSISGGGFSWPMQGGISQFASWYHMALDITNPLGTPIYAAQNASVTRVSVGTWDTGYGNNVWIDNGDGIATHYAHMQGVNVSVGQQVYAGRTIIGWVGLTGRTTGPHLHFEVRVNGSLVNPMSYLP